VNKSAAVREILAKNFHTPVREIVSMLDQRGIRIHPNLVYLIKSKVRAGRRKQRRDKALANSKDLGIANPVELILDLAPGVVCAAVKRQRESLKNPPKTAEELLATLESQGLTQAVARLRQFIDLL
jgi:hypothetical protein